ncbi:MAG: molybdopterin molybdotransferase MoeA [Aquisalinus sp.]|nr:molybdopterin molybdotransferase MoeA [Aquisalinus sp.]
MISVQQALDILLEDEPRPLIETVALTDIQGRVCAETVFSQINQPPFASSAMDGYAVKSSDIMLGAELKIIGEAPAGKPFSDQIQSGEAVRVFTGSVVPAGADHIIIQEDVSRRTDTIIVTIPQSAKHNIRAAGIDLKKGDPLAFAGTRMYELHGSAFAAANVNSVQVFRKPHVAIFTNGDELVEPGTSLSPGQIINSNKFSLMPLIESWGGTCRYLGRADDTEESVELFLKKGLDADILVPVGGASVGDYDHTKTGFSNLGGEILFSKVAVKPGKPTWYGNLNDTKVLGLPGNPASAIVTATLFLRPLIKSLSGEKNTTPTINQGRLLSPLPANGDRENYLRAKVEYDTSGVITLNPAAAQDSSLLKPFLTCDALIRRKPNAIKLEAGAIVEFIRVRGST